MDWPGARRVRRGAARGAFVARSSKAEARGAKPLLFPLLRPTGRGAASSVVLCVVRTPKPPRSLATVAPSQGAAVAGSGWQRTSSSARGSVAAGPGEGGLHLFSLARRGNTSGGERLCAHDQSEEAGFWRTRLAHQEPRSVPAAVRALRASHATLDLVVAALRARAAGGKKLRLTLRVRMMPGRLRSGGRRKEVLTHTRAVGWRRADVESEESVPGVGSREKETLSAGHQRDGRSVAGVGRTGARFEITECFRAPAAPSEAFAQTVRNSA